MDLKIKGKTALVTASSRGFGLETALALAAEGAKVAMCSRGQEDLETAASQVRELGVPVLARPVDVTDESAFEGFFQEVEKDLGPVDLLLVNAGGPPAGTFFELEQADWRAATELMLETSVRLCRLALPGMMDRRWGRIVQVTSVSVVQPVENLVLSSVVRPAVHALTRNLAVEAAPRGVTINSVAPGYHTTSAVDRLIARKIQDEGCTRDDVLAEWAREIPMGRLGDPAELAALITFLMSEQAGYLTGQCLVSDGGWVRATF